LTGEKFSGGTNSQFSGVLKKLFF